MATFCYGDVETDTAGDGDVVSDRADHSKGLSAWLDRQNEGGKSTAETRGSIASWAWGLARGVDYLEQTDGVDPDRIALVGQSRLGKAALLAAATDLRVALVIPCQAGQGGTAPARNPVRETVSSIKIVSVGCDAAAVPSAGAHETRRLHSVLSV